MSMIKKMATAGAVAVMGLGLGAASASAYSISGGAYTGTATTIHSFTVGGGAYTITCPSADTTFEGVADGTAKTAFRPDYGTGFNCEFFGLPAGVTQSDPGPWEITVTGGPNGLGEYTGDVHIPTGTTTTIEVPLAGCTVTVEGGPTGQTFTNAGAAVNTGSGIELKASVTGVAYTASGCPFSSGSDGTYDTNGVVDIPGVTVS